jgi:hypothetical protein
MLHTIALQGHNHHYRPAAELMSVLIPQYRPHRGTQKAQVTSP